MSAANDLTGTDQEKFHQLCSKTHKEQAVWFLNAYWNDCEQDAERFWEYVEKHAELDLQNRAQGSGLDEMMTHRFMEQIGETLTVQKLRQGLRDVGALKPDERPKLCPLTYYLLWKYTKDWKFLVNASQGDNKEKIAEAQRKLDEVVAAFERSRAAAEQAAEALRASQAAERESAQRKQEAEAAKAELEAALAELKAQEDAYNAKTQELERKSNEGGVVSRNRAKNELAQHLGEDPLPLRRAKITQEAAVKKAERANKAAADALAAAQQARQASEDAKAAADAAVEAAREKVAEAEAALEEIKKLPGQAFGTMWWMERELYEQKKYLPLSKGGVQR